MLRQNILQVYLNNKDEITIAKGEFFSLDESVDIESVSVSTRDAEAIIKALREIVQEAEV